MRLICPSCGAQYEVDESVIPDGGRDVQCSNCGHAWFQHSASQLREAEAAAEVTPAVAAPDEAVPNETVPDETAPGEIAPDKTAPGGTAPGGTQPGETAPDPSAAWAERTGDSAETADGALAAGRPRRTLDDAVRNVLREEAERETRARHGEGSSVETQPELGLAAAIGAAAATTGGRVAERDRVADVGSGAGHDFDEDALVSRSSRRELLPDIEEINSSLRATSERGGEAAALDAPETLARRRSGFRMGFTTALIIAAVLLGLYALAPLLTERAPALGPALASYVAAVDAGRVWLDARMQALTAALQSGPPG